MQTIALADTARITSRLGFGCSSLMGSIGRKQSLKLLETAYNAGIRHYDVAPMYGYGEAEPCLGEFLARHKHEVTVTTKFGIAPATSSSWMTAARRTVAPWLQRMPALRRRLAEAAQQVTGAGGKIRFNVEEARASLERSLVHLQVERIDLWLLHEASAPELGDDKLLSFLDSAVASGKIGMFGIGSSADTVTELATLRPAYCRVQQFEWSVLDPTLSASNAFRIHHRALTNNFERLHRSFISDKGLAADWSSKVGVNVADTATLARLMLKASLERNPQSIVLFSSRKPAHILGNAHVLAESSLAKPAVRLHTLIQSEGLPYLVTRSANKVSTAA